MPTVVANGSKLTFGKSTRSYVINIDFTPVERQFEKKLYTIKKDMRMLEVLDKPGLTKNVLKAAFGLID